MSTHFYLTQQAPILCCDPCSCVDDQNDCGDPLETSAQLGIRLAALAGRADPECPCCYGAGYIWEARSCHTVTIPDDVTPLVLRHLGCYPAPRGGVDRSKALRALLTPLDASETASLGSLVGLTPDYVTRKLRAIHLLLDRPGNQNLVWSSD